MTSPAPYELAFQLHGHASDVRHIAAPSPDIPLLLSGSRDGSALLWGPGKGREFDVKLRVEAPEKKYVSCVGMTKWQGEGKSALSLVTVSVGKEGKRWFELICQPSCLLARRRGS